VCRTFGNTPISLGVGGREYQAKGRRVNLGAMEEAMVDLQLSVRIVNREDGKST
jgi:hypothetical protein